jgi:flagellar protein FliJ
MRRFQFRLESVLRVRRFREEQAQLLLAAAQRRLATEEAAKLRLQSALERHQHWLADTLAKELDISKLAQAAAYEEDISKQLDIQNNNVQAAILEVESNLERIRHIHADREVLQRLRETRLAEHYQAELASEQKETDESAVLRWTRPDRRK